MVVKQQVRESDLEEIREGYFRELFAHKSSYFRTEKALDILAKIIEINRKIGKPDKEYEIWISRQCWDDENEEFTDEVHNIY